MIKEYGYSTEYIKVVVSIDIPSYENLIIRDKLSRDLIEHIVDQVRDDFAEVCYPLFNKVEMCIDL